MKFVAVFYAALPLIVKAVETLKVQNGGVYLDPYTDHVRQYLLNKHNQARRHAPGGSANMRELSWNEPLAIEASELAQTCVFAHDTEGGKYGQNLMLGSNDLTDATIDLWMKMWVQDEFTAKDLQGTGYMDLNHDSAVLWANTYLLGCASHMCPTGYLTVCNFWPPGNWVGEQAYKPGPACSACPKDASNCVNGLCSADGTPPTSPPTSPPTTAPPATTPPATKAATAPPATGAPTTAPTANDAQTTYPPATDAPTTASHATNPPTAPTAATETQRTVPPPGTDAPNTAPPATNPPINPPALTTVSPTPATTSSTPFPTVQPNTSAANERASSNPVAKSNSNSNSTTRPNEDTKTKVNHNGVASVLVDSSALLVAFLLVLLVGQSD